MKNTPSIPKSRLSQAITMALLTGALVPATAFAGSGSCSDGANSINTAVTQTCELDTDNDSLVIGESGSITVSATGVLSDGGTYGQVTNNGLIEATSGMGIYVYGNFGNITNNGTINSSSHGVYVYGTTGDITNSGLIEAGAQGIYIYAGNFDGGRTSVGNIINSGTIIADYKGIYVYGGGGAEIESITNSGTIMSGVTDDDYGSGIYIHNNDTEILGDITNSGLIQSSDYGIYIYAETIRGSIINSGVIDAGASGIYVFTNIDGDLVNSGTIQTDSYGAYVYGVGGDLINSGLLNSGWTGMYVYGAGVGGDLTNSGTIQAGSYGFYIYGDVDGDVLNSGLIESDYTGIYVYGDVGGNVTNTGTIVSEDGHGIYVYAGDVGGDVTNSGLIVSYEGALYVYGNVGGDLINSGTIVADGIGMGAHSVGGDVLNTGLIESSYDGIYIYGDVGGSVINSGAIVSDETGLYVYGNVGGDLINSGTIIATTGIYAFGGWADNSISGSVINSGTIMSEYSGIYIYANHTVHGDVINSGLISSEWGNGLYVYGNVGGNIENSGIIIAGDDNLGLGISDDSLIGGKVINSGSIMGYLEIDTEVDVENSGLIDTRTNSSYVEGNYSQSASGEFRIAVNNSDEDYGSLDVDGTASFATGTTLSVSGSSLLLEGDQIEDVITADELEAEASDFVIKDNLLSRSFKVLVDSDSVDLEVSETGLTTVAAAIESSRINTGAGAAIDAIIGENPEGDVAYGFGSLNSVAEVADAIETTLPALAGGLAQSSLNTGRSLTSIIGARQAGVASGDDTPSNEGMWVKYVSGSADQDGSNGVSGYDVDSRGFAIGTDRDISANWNLGYALAFIQNEIDSGAGQNVDSDTLIGKVYATRDIKENTQLNLQLGLGTANNDGYRKIFTGSSASSDYDSKLIQATAELARSYERSEKTSYAPYVSLDYSKANVEGYSESGAGALNLNVGATSAESLVLGVGARASHTTTDKFKLTGIVGLGYDMQADNSSVTSSFQGGGARFGTQGIEPEAIAYNLGLGASYDLNDATELSANYDLTNRSDYSDKLVSLKAKWNF